MRLLDLTLCRTLPHLMVKARIIKWLSIMILILQIPGHIFCAITMAYCLSHPGYWTNWQYITILVYSVVGFTCAFDIYQLLRYVFGMAGSSRLLNNEPVSPKGTKDYRYYAYMTIIHSMDLFGWFTMEAIMLCIDHGKDFRKAFDDPPVVAWWLTFVGACILTIPVFGMIILCHREQKCMELQGSRDSLKTVGEAAAEAAAAERAQRAKDEANAEALDEERRTAELIKRTIQLQRLRYERAERLRQDWLRENARYASGEV